MSGRNTAITISVDELLDAANRVGRIDGMQIAAIAIKTVNEVTDRTYDLARERITAGINLSDDYLRRRMTVDHASQGNFTAEITAAGDRTGQTRLATYDPQMTIVPRATKGRNRNKARLGIAAGSKQAGVSVEVTRGGRKTVAGGFLLPLKQGTETGSKFGVFTRNGDKKVHRYGPAVYQLFRWQAPRLVDEVSDDLESSLLRNVDELLKEVLS